MTDPNIVQPADGICPLCWGPSTTAGACTSCIDHFNRHTTEEDA